jgi:hypothetical protein
MAKNSFIFRKATAKARVLPPVPTDGLTDEDVAKLREDVKSRIDVARRELLRELGITAAA